jgi:hypothetical protein
MSLSLSSWWFGSKVNDPAVILEAEVKDMHLDWRISVGKDPNVLLN